MTSETTHPYRFSWGGDEFLFVEIDEEMSLAANFRAAALCKAIAAEHLEGIIDICPSNASLLIRFNPDVLAPDVLLATAERLAAASSELDGQQLETRIIEVPVWYDDPFTNEVGARFRSGHQTPDATDLDFAAEENGFASRAEFIEAHHSSPWIVTMVGFVAGLPFMYQMTPRSEQLEVPKYLSPRTDTPKLTVGHGGCFAAIYSVRGAGGYQMFGVAAAPIYDPQRALPDFADSIVLFNPGDIVKFVPVSQERYNEIQADVDAGTWRYTVHPVSVDISAAVADPTAYNEKLLEVLGGN